MNNPLKNKKILITCGPTWVPIDEIRVITNRSTGELGHTLARDLKNQGAEITLLEGPVTHGWQTDSIKVIKFHFYEELKSALCEELKKNYDIIIHAAAVSDYRLKTPYKAKLRSDFSEINLKLVRTEKIIDKIKKLNPKAFLVGFKQEMTADPEVLKKKALSLFAEARCDLVVANCITPKYRSYILDGMNHILAKGHSRQQIVKSLVSILKRRIA